tara:strand:- start:1122 stop:1604 length:483 start_codon:yes stop_codon:yes gene_type:complete
MNLLAATAVISAALGCAVVGGIFFAFSNFIMKALARLSSAEGIAAMQSVNVTVLNKWFLGVFTGTALVSLLLAGYAIANWSTPFAPWLLGGSVAYVVGCWLLTIVGNVPLNNTLADTALHGSESTATWEHYLKRWTALNSQRALGSVVAAFLFIIALMLG